ncbi:PspA/IM30 family protein [Roseateles sp.]|uniref:PspA/IM30 family protein n=1 Tax=Roseateles sp. TaxID=1971397 RepID=UPI003264A21E
MADHQVTSRLWNLWNGFLGLWIQKKENAHPEIAYQNSIQSMTQKYMALKQAAGRVISRRDALRGQVETAERDLAKVTRDLAAAVATSQDDLAMVLIQKKNQLTEGLGILRPELATAETDADTMKNNLIEVQGEIQNLKAEKDRMVGLLQSAEARIQIQSSLDGLSLDAEVQALGGVREHIKGRIAEANLGAELRSTDLDVRMKDLTRKSASISARAELEAMKAAAAQTAAQASGGSTGGNRTL